MSVAIGVNTAALGKVVDLRIASPQERRTDSACAAQDAATETQSQGTAQTRSPLDRLLDTPGPLDRFAASGEMGKSTHAQDGTSA